MPTLLSHEEKILTKIQDIIDCVAARADNVYKQEDQEKLNAIYIKLGQIACELRKTLEDYNRLKTLPIKSTVKFEAPLERIRFCPYCKSDTTQEITYSYSLIPNTGIVIAWHPTVICLKCKKALQTKDEPYAF